jgi:hypothetical protein
MMEELILFLFFVIFGILSAIAKVRKDKKKSKSANARGREGLAVRIRAWLIDLQQRIETQSKKAPKGTFDWEQLIDGSKLTHTDTTPHDEAREDIDLDTVKETPSPLPEAAPAAASPPTRMPTQPLEKPDMMAFEPPRMAIKPRRKPVPSVLPTSRSDLRQAIVWSEILGPPIALRDPFKDNW